MPKQRRKQQVTDTNKGESTHSHEADSRGLKVSEWIALSAFSLSILGAIWAVWGYWIGADVTMLAFPI